MGVGCTSLPPQDEPTSGLDSTASKLVVQCLQRVARTGVTVAAVIHQPSWETFCLFDDLILLAKGGLTAYYGPQEQVQVWL
jgi:ABC-type multidrug transport system ATPase subunit